MNIIGLILEQTLAGVPLDNGGACLIQDGIPTVLVNEERLTRRQYDHGFAASLQYIFEASGLNIEDIDLFVVSTCLEPQRTRESAAMALQAAGFAISPEKIAIVDHHLGHAASAYYPSGFDRAIVMVADGDGNLKDFTCKHDQNLDAMNFWRHAFEHQSYYIGENGNLRHLTADPTVAGMNGLGGAYRYFTYFCGFPGYKYAGKLMGLSAYGTARNRFEDLRLFELDQDGGIVCTLPDCDRNNSVDVVERWFAERGVTIKGRRQPSDPITEDIEDAAWLVQRELNRIMVARVKKLVAETGITKLCLAGGVALNAVTNRALLDEAGIIDIFIQPAAGDSGQCLGNAALGARQLGEEVKGPFPIYLGRNYSEEEIEAALAGLSSGAAAKLSDEELISAAAEAIADGKNCRLVPRQK